MEAGDADGAKGNAMNPAMIPEKQISWYPTIEADACIGVRDCLQICENNVLEWDVGAGHPVVIRPENCEAGCTACMEACPVKAIRLPTPEPPGEPRGALPSKKCRARIISPDQEKPRATAGKRHDRVRTLIRAVWGAVSRFRISVGFPVRGTAQRRGLQAAACDDPPRGRADARYDGRQITLPCFVLVAAIVLVLPALAPAQGWWWGSPITPGFDRNTVIRVSGTAAHVSLNARVNPATLTLECPRDTYTVILGPGWYLVQLHADVREGDLLVIEGSTMMDRSGNLHLVAARVTDERTGFVIELRDEMGRPLWMQGPRPGRMMR